jgi:hypothetical protein
MLTPNGNHPNTLPLKCTFRIPYRIVEKETVSKILLITIITWGYLPNSIFF